MISKYLTVGRETYTSESVLRLVAEDETLCIDPKEIIRCRAREVVSKARGMGLSGPPFNPRILASCEGISLEETSDLSFSKDAELNAMCDGRFLIRYSPDMAITRQNFSIAHEIAHTFFPDCSEQLSLRGSTMRKYFDPSDEVEMLCDIAAAEMLMPVPEFAGDMHGSDMGVELLEELRELYGCSRVATAIRMVQLTICSCILVVFDHHLKPTEIARIERDRLQGYLLPELREEAPEPKLRVRFAVPSDYFTGFIPRDKSVNEDSPIWWLSQNFSVFKGYCDLDLCRERKRFYVEAMSIPPMDELYSVMAFLF